MDEPRHDGSSRAGREQPSQRPRPKVLFVCADPVGEEMAGLGIRFWELARVLSDHANVSLAHGGDEEGQRNGVQLIAFSPHAPRALRKPIADAHAIIAHPQWPLVNAWLRRAAARIVIDLYCPETLETLELTAGRPAAARRQLTAITIDRLHASLRIGHNFMCASETQRDLWLGAMLALRLIDPRLYASDPELRGVIDLVPFGLPEDPPRADTQAGPRQAIPELGPDSEIVLWNGGIWSWLDADTAIRAVAAVAERRPSVRLVFMGAGADHPAAAASAQAARALARELGLLGTVVHFHERWIPYAQRGAWLAQAACALSTHREHLESRFAYRTRLLDCLWARLPIVCTTGDDLAERVQREDLGAVVAPGDAQALAAALEQVLQRGRAPYGPALGRAAGQQTWAKVAQPLIRWLSEPVPPARPGQARGAVRRPFGQRLREAVYLAGGRALLARRRR